jgi:tripartite-type tricarboxylate transporter receptor subunit TctC
VTLLVAGQVQVMFDVTPTSLPQIKAGKVRPLDVTTTERLPFLPDVPTIDSFFKGYEAAGWIGFGIPKGTPRSLRRSTSITRRCSPSFSTTHSHRSRALASRATTLTRY